MNEKFREVSRVAFVFTSSFFIDPDFYYSTFIIRFYYVCWSIEGVTHKVTFTLQ